MASLEASREAATHEREHREVAGRAAEGLEEVSREANLAMVDPAAADRERASREGADRVHC